MNYLEYALAYLERELEIIDDEVIEVELLGRRLGVCA